MNIGLERIVLEDEGSFLAKNILKGFILVLTQLNFNSSNFFLDLKVALITSSGIILIVYVISSLI